MTAVIRTFPANETALARLTQRQRERNFAEEMEDRARMEAQAAFWTRRSALPVSRSATPHTTPTTSCWTPAPCCKAGGATRPTTCWRTR